MLIANVSTDPLMHFLPSHCDARLVSHYLALLAENEVRLKEQLKQVQEELRQRIQDTLPIQPTIEKSPAPPLKITKRSFQPIEEQPPQPIIAEKLYERGMLYFTGYDDHPVDLDLAIEIFKQALEWEHPEAEMMLGECYYFAEEKPDHLKESLSWYKKAAQKNHRDAIYSVGYMYHYGMGTRVDHTKALKFISKAAAAGSIEAQNFLAELSRR